MFMRVCSFASVHTCLFIWAGLCVILCVILSKFLSLCLTICLRLFIRLCLSICVCPYGPAHLCPSVCLTCLSSCPSVCVCLSVHLHGRLTPRLQIAQEYCTRVRSRNSQFDSDWSSVVTAATRSDDIVCPVVQTAPPVECPTTDGRTVDIGGNQGSLTPTSSSSTALVTVIILAIIGAVLVAILSGILYLQRSPLSKKAPGASLAAVKPRENGGDSFLGPSSMPTVGSQKTPLGYAPSASTLASLAGPTASLPKEPPILEMQPMLAAADKDVDADEDYEAMPVDVRHVDPNVLSMVQNPGEATAPDPFTSSGLESKEAVADDYLEPSQMPAIGKGAPNDGGNASREDGPTAENAAETTSTGNDNVVGSAASGDGDGADQTNDGGGDYMNTVLHAAVDSSAPAATASASSLTAGGLERERVDSVLYTKPKRDRQVSVNSEMSDEARLFRPSRQDV